MCAGELRSGFGRVELLIDPSVGYISHHFVADGKGRFVEVVAHRYSAWVPVASCVAGLCAVVSEHGDG